MIDWRHAMRVGMKTMERVMTDDVVDRLRKMLPPIGTCESDINAVVVSTIQDALAEIQYLRATIEQLRSVAGAVSLDVVSLADIKKDPRKFTTNPVLGEFTDGK